MDLEDAEDPIPRELQNRIQEYGRLSSAERIFTGEDQDPRLAQILVDAFRKWIIENGATRVPAETGNHHLICCGVGCIREEKESSPNKIYPVFIDEPLAIISLGSILKGQLWTQRKALLQNSFAIARNPSSLGFISEEMALLVVMENFGGKFVALGHIFHGDDPHLLQRKVSLVALKQISDGIMQCCPVSWNAGASDRLGVKASSPAHVLEFLRNPDGIPFLFPGIHMGPDLIAYLQDQETKELIALTLQAKFDHRLDKGSWINAVDSTTPAMFYTMMDEKIDQYAPVQYPTLKEDVEKFFELALGSEVYQPVIGGYRGNYKLCGSAQQVSSVCRRTPPFLQVVVAPDYPGPRGDTLVMKREVLSEFMDQPSLLSPIILARPE